MIKYILILVMTIFNYAFAASDNSTKCITDALYHEARGLSKGEREYIYSVIKNRTEDSRFPKSPCAVIYQVTKYKNKRVYQFSWVKRMPKINDKKTYYKIESEVLDFMDSDKKRHSYLFFKKPRTLNCNSYVYMRGRFCHKFR